MVRLLNMNVKEYISFEEFNKEDEIILVDAQKGNSNIIDMNGQEIICIDHHPVYEHIDYRFCDIRPDVGACASIIASYYFDNDIDMPADGSNILYESDGHSFDMRRVFTTMLLPFISFL